MNTSFKKRSSSGTKMANKEKKKKKGLIPASKPTTPTPTPPTLTPPTLTPPTPTPSHQAQLKKHRGTAASSNPPLPNAPLFSNFHSDPPLPLEPTSSFANFFTSSHALYKYDVIQPGGKFSRWNTTKVGGEASERARETSLDLF